MLKDLIMTIKVKFCGTRPDTSAPLWWDADIDLVKNSNRSVIELSELFEITHSTVISDDGLSYESIFICRDQDLWKTFTDVLVDSYPEILQARNDYFIQNNHTIRMVMSDADTDEVLQEIEDLI